ncbi:hypothetical protein H6F74_09600 [Trichocoleus sp. FACHB-90]|uniref:hypothetical protein n=1 Tax=Cyanophyceae TaxID=3028117 RepID=UPI001687F344|nr:hypothetical protein [Trichocoleus sp. FACHB-90]MBD1926496.1 hypothetical protein [Trichocoleus sp. FACHB-90]
MNAADKKAVEQAKKGKAKAGRSQANAEQGSSNIQAKLDEARQTVRKSTKNYIVGGGIGDALQDIAAGDFGDIGNDVIDALNAFVSGIDNAHLTLEAAESDPKYLLPSESSNLSSLPSYSTTEAEGI